MSKRPKGGSPKRAPRARNPFALHARRRKAGAEPSPQAYRRRPKHRAAAEIPLETEKD
jgi:hypothetical protein